METRHLVQVIKTIILPPSDEIPTEFTDLSDETIKTASDYLAYCNRQRFQITEFVKFLNEKLGQPMQDVTIVQSEAQA
jgi:hypothetical protein